VSGAKSLVTFDRVGGRPPADDEAVTIAVDGTFTAHRTLGGRRIGRFAGSLPPATLRALTRDVDGVADADDVAIATPADGATETVRIGRRARVRLGSNERPPGPWAALVGRLRDVLREVVVESPIAALELQDTDDGGVRLAHAGTEPLELDLAGASWQATRLDAQQVPVARTGGAIDAAAAGEALGAWTRAIPGWTLDLPVREAASPADGSGLQVVVYVTVRDGDDLRDGRLIAVRGL
jgi:hypothetical protein